jgi:hypothetical protein
MTEKAFYEITWNPVDGEDIPAVNIIFGNQEIEKFSSILEFDSNRLKETGEAEFENVSIAAFRTVQMPADAHHQLPDYLRGILAVSGSVTKITRKRDTIPAVVIENAYPSFEDETLKTQVNDLLDRANDFYSEELNQGYDTAEGSESINYLIDAKACIDQAIDEIYKRMPVDELEGKE